MERSLSTRPSLWRRVVALVSEPISQGFLLSSVCKAIALFNWLFTIRLVMPYLGVEKYGIVATVSSSGAFVALTDFGLGQGLVNIAARAAARSEEESDYLVCSTSCAFWGLALIAAALLTVVAGFAIGGTLIWPQEDAPPMFHGILVLAACMLLMQPFSVATKLRTGFQQYIQLYFWQLCGILGALLAVCVASVLRLDELWIIAALFLPAALAQVGNTIHLFCFERPLLAPRFSLFRWAEAKKLITSGMTPFLSSASSSVIFTAPIWCLASLFGATMAASYYVLFRLMSPLVVLSNMLTTPMWPAYAQSFALSRFGDMKRLLRLSLGLVLTLNIAGLALLMRYLPKVLRLLTKGMLTSLPMIQVSVVGVLIIMMSIRQTLTMAVLGSAQGSSMRWVFALGLGLSLGLPWARGVFSHSYQVIFLFIGLEIALNVAAVNDLIGFNTAVEAELRPPISQR